MKKTCKETSHIHYIGFILSIEILMIVVPGGFKHLNKINSIDLNVVRLCFQVFLPDENGKITRIVPPVVSQCIHDKSKSSLSSSLSSSLLSSTSSSL